MKNFQWILIPITWRCSKKFSKTLVFPENELNGTSYVLKIALITSQRKQPAIFSPELAVMPTRSMIRENGAPSKKSLDVQKCRVSVAKHIVVMINRLTSTSLAAKDSIKELWKTVAMDQCQHTAVLEEEVNTTPTNRGFRTIQHNNATYEQTKKVLSYYHPKRMVEEDVIYTKALHL